MKVDQSLIHRLFYPQVPLVMGARFGRRVSAMPVVSYTSVSDSPPMIVVACNPASFTCKLALKAGSFSLSILDRENAGAISFLAKTSGAKLRDKLAASGLRHTDGTKLRVPVLEAAAATLECRLKSKKKFGDHILLVGHVEAAYATQAFTDFWDFSQYRPMLYTGWRDRMTTYPGT